MLTAIAILIGLATLTAALAYWNKKHNTDAFVSSLNNSEPAQFSTSYSRLGNMSYEEMLDRLKTSEFDDRDPELRS